MTIFAGLDVSDKTVHVCVVDDAGVVLQRDVVATDPEVLAKWLKRHCSVLVRVVLETGPLSTFLYHGLVERGVPAICICARHAKKALSARVNKSDVNDAESLAQLCRTGWFKPVLSACLAGSRRGGAYESRRDACGPGGAQDQGELR
jgi:transposase